MAVVPASGLPSASFMPTNSALTSSAVARTVMARQSWVRISATVAATIGTLRITTSTAAPLLPPVLRTVRPRWADFSASLGVVDSSTVPSGPRCSIAAHGMVADIVIGTYAVSGADTDVTGPVEEGQLISALVCFTGIRGWPGREPDRAVR